MNDLFSRAAFRSAPTLRRLLVLSLVVSAVIIVFTKAKTGVYLGCLTDHFHHTRATWNFFNLGFDVYSVTQDQACATVRYPHHPGYTCTWGTWPVAYPPGMFAVFTFPAIVGRSEELSNLVLGKITIAYLTLLTHAALWAFAILARRVGSRFWVGVVAFFWIFMVRLALVGMYEGAWLLTATLAVHAIHSSRPARGLLWLAASALLGYRAVCLVPIALYAAVHLPRSGETLRAKGLAVGVSAAAGAIVIACARALVRNGPADVGHSPFVPLQPYGWLLLGVGFAAAIVVALGSSWVVGASVAFSSFLGLYHAGHNWHGSLCVAPLLALVLARRRSLTAQVVVGVWLVFYLHYVFGYPPFLWVEELIRLFHNGGRPGCLLPFES